MRHISIIARHGIVLLSLTAVSFYASAGKFLQTSPEQSDAPQIVEVPPAEQAGDLRLNVPEPQSLPAQKPLLQKQPVQKSSAKKARGQKLTGNPLNSGSSVSLLQEEWEDSGIRDKNNQFELFFTKSIPIEQPNRKIQFSFMTQGIGGHKSEFNNQGKPTGVYFNRMVDTWVMDCSDFTGYQLSKTYLMDDNIVYSRKLKLENYNIQDLEKVAVFPDTDVYNAVKYYCGR